MQRSEGCTKRAQKGKGGVCLRHGAKLKQCSSDGCTNVAKGGILLAVAKKYKLPIIALGLGEKEDDLQIFEAEKFADAFTQIN